MEDYNGDLADILRSGGRQVEAGATTEVSQLNQSDAKDDYLDDFGNPFSTIFKDPLFANLDIPITSFFSSQPAPKLCCDDDDDDNYRYSIHHQISPKLLSSSSHIISSCSTTTTNSPRLLKPLIATNHELICSDYHNHIMISGNTSKSSNSTSTNCFAENNGVQISSPRYTGIKRRKGQAKKVVCIPAPAPVNSRPTGEIVPSDLWAWRKYGQKPIKGSPYPRGYYRCSSSKGCSARKQVERSRTEPNMLVITYTSEHNHPWPTQRNALAGSTKNQPPSKNNINNNNNSAKASPTTTVSNHSQKSPLLIMKEEQKEIIISNINTNINVKDVEEKDTKLDGDDGESSLYSPAGALPTDECIYHPPDQDFFAELGEIEADDPLNLMIFTQGITNKVATLDDPFGFYN